MECGVGYPHSKAMWLMSTSFRQHCLKLYIAVRHTQTVHMYRSNMEKCMHMNFKNCKIYLSDTISNILIKYNIKV
jgi:hypothetical protein